MNRLVVDASVALKWFFRDRPDEADATKALSILQAIGQGQVGLHQPPHFPAEVAAVLARLKPREAQEDLADFLELEFQVHDSATVYQGACDLAVELGHHLFDTFYHAVALCVPDTELITADEAYYRKAAGIGGIRLLSQFSPA